MVREFGISDKGSVLDRYSCLVRFAPSSPSHSAPAAGGGSANLLLWFPKIWEDFVEVAWPGGFHMEDRKGMRNLRGVVRSIVLLCVIVRGAAQNAGKFLGPLFPGLPGVPGGPSGGTSPP